MVPHPDGLSIGKDEGGLIVSLLTLIAFIQVEVGNTLKKPEEAEAEAFTFTFFSPHRR